MPRLVIVAVTVLASALALLPAAEPAVGQPVEPVSFKHAGVVDAWKAYAGRLTFGEGQTLALVDDGCDLARPEWARQPGVRPKVLVSYDSVDGDDNPKHEGKGYHGSTIGIPSSLNHKGKWGVAYNDQVAVVRALECCHCNVRDSKTLAAGLRWVHDNREKYRITAVNLAPVDDQAHDKPVPTEIDAELAKLRRAGVWVSAPAGNHNFTTGISWPACQPDCIAVGAVRPGKDEVYLDRHAKIDLVVPAAATSSSNAIACGAALVLREAVEKNGYDWKGDGRTLPEALLAIMQQTGKPVADPGTGRTFRRLDLKAALDHVFAGAGRGAAPPAADRPALPGARGRLAAGQPLKVVCLGDSVTGVYYHTGGRRAYPEMLAVALRKLYPAADVTVVNAGISGNSTADALKRLERDVLAHRPQLVTVMFGLNDMVRVPIDQFRANLSTIIRKCRDAGAEVLLCTPNGVISTPGRPVEKLAEYCDAMRAVGRQEKVHVCDVYAAYEALRARDARAWRLLLSDEIHPNMDGHKLDAQEIARTITGRAVSLDDVGPLQPAVPRTLARLKASEPIRVLAMPPYDALIGPALKQMVPSARVEVTAWPTAGRTLPQLERDAKAVRQKKPDLVLLAVPASAKAESEEQAIRSYTWVLNWSLSFGHQEWDVVGILPSVAKPDLTPEDRRQDAFARHLIRAQDLSLIERKPGDDSPAEKVLTEWLRGQMNAAAK